MPPKIMFRVFFSRIEDAQNDNIAGFDSAGSVAPETRRHGMANGDAQAASQDDQQSPSFFGSRLADAVAKDGAARILSRRAAPDRSTLSGRSHLLGRSRLQVIDGSVIEEGAIESDAKPGAAPKRPLLNQLGQERSRL